MYTNENEDGKFKLTLKTKCKLTECELSNTN